MSASGTSPRAPETHRRARRGLGAARPSGAGIAFVALAVLVALVAVEEILRTRQVGALLPRGDSTLSAAALVRARAITDGDRPAADEPLWTVAPRGGRVVVLAFDVRARTAREVLREELSLPGSRRPTDFDIGRWDPDARAPALFAMRRVRRGIDVRVVPATGGTRPLARGLAPAPPPPPGGRRDLAVGTWSGSRPDVFVVDRPRPPAAVSVSVYSGESRFRARVLRRALPLRGFDPAQWSADVARLRGEALDLLLYRTPRANEYPEIRALSGESGFQADEYRLPVRIAAAEFRPVVGALGGVPTLYVPIGRHGVVRLFPMFRREDL